MRPVVVALVGVRMCKLLSWGHATFKKTIGQELYQHRARFIHFCAGVVHLICWYRNFSIEKNDVKAHLVLYETELKLVRPTCLF